MFEIGGNNVQEKFRVAEAGPPVQAAEVRNELPQFFVLVGTSLNDGLPRLVLPSKEKTIYEEYIEQKQQRVNELVSGMSCVT